MMHNDNLVACVKVNGQILRESGSSVSLPFGCEYSILVKNLNSVRAQIAVSVDGKDAVGRIVIAPNSSVELERFMQNGNLGAGNRFKFIERSPEIEQHRGIGSDDGLIRVEGWRENVERFVDIPTPRYRPYGVPRPIYPPRYPYPPQWAGSIRRPMAMHARSAPRPMHATSRGPSPPRANLKASLGNQREPDRSAQNEVGITVPGSESRQGFVSVSGFPLELESAVVVLRLRGHVGAIPVPGPVTVGMKPVCETCGGKNKADSQYCSKCGTALILFA